jgi:hypothetical protein
MLLICAKDFIKNSETSYLLLTLPVFIGIIISGMDCINKMKIEEKQDGR